MSVIDMETHAYVVDKLRSQASRGRRLSAHVQGLREACAEVADDCPFCSGTLGESPAHDRDCALGAVLMAGRSR